MTKTDLIPIICLYCQDRQEVSRRAITVTCRKCNKSLRIEDLSFKRYEARRHIDTVGVVVIEKKGNVVSEQIMCGGMIARGQVRGKIISRGPVLVGPDATVTGDVEAPTMAIGEGAKLKGFYRVGPQKPAEPAAAPHA
ncbi:MAG: polymer-forming cytoskeletal protein [Phycisphaerae bacterium]